MQLRNLPKTNYKSRASLQKEIREARTYDKILNGKAKEMLEGYCLNLNQPAQYCENYFKQSFWSKTNAESSKSEILKAYCPPGKRKQCLANLNQKPEYCHYAAQNYPALFPKPDCDSISTALLNSRIQSYYQDCPTLVGNDSVTSFSRLLNHFEQYLKKPFTQCELNSTFPFAKASEELDVFQSWGVKVCFINKLNQNKKECYPTVLGDSGDNKLSLANTIYKIASRTKGYAGNRCEVISKKQYRPSLLKFQTGCFIIRDLENCTGVQCKLEVFLGELKFKDFFIEPNLNFNLLPIDFINENKAMVNRYSKVKKKNSKAIKNITAFLSTFKNHKKALYIGIGCAEDLLPSFFYRRFLNQCSPLPFLVDGFIENEKTYSLITRTSIDQINSPRIIPWTQLFAGIKQYQLLHPTGAWGFYAIY